MRTVRFFSLSALLLIACSGLPEISGGGDDLMTGGTGNAQAGAPMAGTGGDGPSFSFGGSAGGPQAGSSGSGGSGGVDTSGCGDGVVQATVGEMCDDGNNDAGDGCSADCATVETDFVCLKPGKPCESTVKCGDGKLGGAEICDDGNTKAGDGCDKNCELEDGWMCPAAGEACQAAKCGDGIVAGVEQCEDDNATPANGDGCSDNCAIEPGYVCDQPGSPCRKAVCGDGVVEGGEPCDDGNQIVGDGCSPLCEAEPVCDKPSDADGCSSRCGDGLLLAGESEECDDGNKRDGDGCSADCLIEDGYECEEEAGTLPDALTIPFVFRDFVAIPSATTTMKRHPDFQAQCTSQLRVGMVNGTLDTEGKPVNSGDCNLAAACSVTVGPFTVSAADWCSPINQSCPPGTTNPCHELHANHPLATHPTDDPFKFWYRDTSDVNKTLVVPTTLTLTNGAYRFESGALYPFDGAGWTASGDEATYQSHNYGFTTEVRRWFSFNGGELLTFNGDDDVWVFVNGKLALDIGGVHETVVRTIRLNADGTVDCKEKEPGAAGFDALTDCEVASRDLGLELGKVYEVVLFHAERHTKASNFRLALTGFVSAKSKCKEVCGDGTQTPGEQCDDGDQNDDGAYGGCTTACKLGPHCGDGVRQKAHEECDDGKNLTPYSPDGEGCAPGCKLPSSCGDGQVDSLFGEECDDGAKHNKGEYGGCNPDCTLGPRCGDGTVDAEEGCDDHNAVSGDGCSSKCVIEIPT
jgi:fibro-slime domain-containing protein